MPNIFKKLAKPHSPTDHSYICVYHAVNKNLIAMCILLVTTIRQYGMHRTIWTELELSILCDTYKQYSNTYSIHMMAYIVHSKMTHSAQIRKIPTMGAIRCALRRCLLLAQNTNTNMITGVSHNHYRVWTKVAYSLYTYIPVFSWNFIIRDLQQSIYVRVLGPVYVNGAPLCHNTISSHFTVLPYIMNKTETEYSARTGNVSYKRIVSADEIHKDGTPRVIEIYTYRILKDLPIITITNLRKTYQYDSLATYCGFYMDGFVKAVHCKCKYMNGNAYNEFVSYFYNVKDRIECDDDDDICEKKHQPLTTDEIMKWVDILDARHVLEYYNSIIVKKWIDMRYDSTL